MSGTKSIDSLYAELDKKFKLSKDVNFELYRGCIEASINSCAHAYIDTRALSAVNHKHEAWWLFAEKRNGYLNVAICDLGVGIAATIPRNYPFLARFVKIFRNNSNAEIILRAIDMPNKSSRTGKTYRGNGLPAIANVAKNLSGADLKIFSYQTYINISKTVKKVQDGHGSIQGTIINWKIPIGDKYEQDYFNRK